MTRKIKNLGEEFEMLAQRFSKAFLSLLILMSASFMVVAQDKSFSDELLGKAVLWEESNIKGKNLYQGPGGVEMRPNLSKVTFIKEEKAGHNKKYRIKDGMGREWVAKLGREAQPETAAVRLMWALGYKTEINYLVPSLTIPGKGTFQNVRLEARPDDIKRGDEWKWKKNPFVGSKEFQGLKILMVFFNNWDIVDVQNKILTAKGEDDPDQHYIVSDMGATFGRLGNNNFPVVYRLGRSVNKPDHYAKTKLVKDVKGDRVILSYKGKNRGLFKNISVDDARWLAKLMNQLSDKQIEDAFRAANYSAVDTQKLKMAVKSRIAELNRVSSERNMAQNAR